MRQDISKFKVLQNASVDAPQHLGHRQRLKKKFALNSHALWDYELLEMLLFNVFPRKDTKPIAKDILQKFGTIKSFLFASEPELKKVPGLGESSIIFTKLLREIYRRISLQPLKEEPIISSNIHVLEYYQNLLSLEKKEQFRVMFINNKNRLIAEEQLQQGTIDQTPIYPREVIQKALNYGASAIIIVHNHPSGDFTPSQDDISVTHHLAEIAKQINIKLLDHIIIGIKGSFSFVKNGLL